MHLFLHGHGPPRARLTRALKIALKTSLASTCDRLPPTRLLVRELGFSRNTVLAAHEQMRVEPSSVDAAVCGVPFEAHA